LLDREVRGEEILVIGDTPLEQLPAAGSIGAKIWRSPPAFHALELESHRPTWAVTDLQKVRAREICDF